MIETIILTGGNAECPNCKWPVRIQTPFKWCNHVYYPENACKSHWSKESDWMSYEDWKEASS